MSGSELSEVAYKKGNWMRYTLWGMGAVCVALLFTTFLNLMTSELSASIPSGYRFIVTDDYAGHGRMRTSYYIYDNKILVERESFSQNKVDRTVMIYDGIDTTGLILDESQTAEICEFGTCYTRPAVLATIKELVAHRVGREYLGL